MIILVVTIVVVVVLLARVTDKLSDGRVDGQRAPIV